MRAERRRAAGRRRRHPGRARRPQAADQDRRPADPRALARSPRQPPGRRRDHRDDGAGPPRRGAGDRQLRRLHQGRPDPRGRRHPQRHHAARPRRAGRPRLQAAAARRRPTAGEPAHRERVLRRARRVRRRRRRDPVRRHDHRGRRGQHDQGHPAPGAPASRPDTSGVPRQRAPGGVRQGSAGPELRGDRRLHGRAPLPPGRPDLGGPRRRAEHEGHRADRPLPGRQALPADEPGPAGRRRRGPVPIRARRQDDGRVRRELRHRCGHRHDRGRLRRDGVHVQQVQHPHPRRAA